MQQKISAGLTYCMANSKGDANVISLVNSLSNQNRFITEQVSYVHMSSNGYELETTYIRAVTAMSWRMPNGKSAISS